MPSASLALLLALSTLGSVRGVALQRLGSGARANPIRKVVTMLTMMEKKVEAEGKAAEAVYEEFMCYCKKGTAGLEASIKAAEERAPQLESTIESSGAAHTTLLEDLKTHKSDRAAAESTVQTADALREKEAKAFAAESTDLKSNIAALSSAIASLEKGVGFLQQGPAVAKLRSLAVSTDMSSGNRDMLVAFLQGGSKGEDSDGSAYAPQSGEIIGILKQMKDEMEADLAGVESEEESAIANHESLSLAKKKEIAAATKAIESKQVRAGDLAVELASLKNELEDTKEGLAEDTAFAANLGKSCEVKTAEWTEYQKTQTEEMVALADTIKLLNDDDALELFKKTLPSASASFLQLSTLPAKDVRQHAVAILRRGHRRGDPRLDLLEMALRGNTAGFEGVMAKCDELVVLLNKEQGDDDAKKAFCESEIDKVEDEKKVVERTIADAQTAIAEADDSMEALKSDIAAFEKGLADLDAEVKEQTSLRKKEHAGVVETIASNSAAKELLEVAKNRLYKFYNPSLHKEAPKRVLAEDDQIVVNMGGTAPPTPAPGGIANTGISASFLQSEDTAAPDADLTYTKKTEDSGGVVAMLDLLRADLSKQITVMETEEKEAQEDYEVFIEDSSAKRNLDSKSLMDKKKQMAKLAVEIEKKHEGLREENTALADTNKELMGVHAECDWLLDNFKLRKDARADEIDSLQKAKAVLSGADYSL